jgi:selenocysteine lyase/cysteine desulfurase
VTMLHETQPMSADLALVGAGQAVPLIDGGTRPYVNLDYAASTPALVPVAQAVDEFLPWYSSVHRGAGFKSQVSTAAYEGAREEIRRFFRARADDAVLITRNTTDAINLLASALPEETHVFAFGVEHHANMLPWRRARLKVTYLPIPASPAHALQYLEEALQQERTGETSRKRATPQRLVAVTGASNVTGEVWPHRDLVELAHRYGARVVLDGAQIAAHYPIDVAGLDVDYLAVSGHKMYAPYGAGALLGRPDWLGADAPYLYGGGAVEFVTLESVLWAPLPERQEAGSPNVVGAIAMGAACRALSAYGMERLAEEEMALARYARDRIGRIGGVERYGIWSGEVPRLGIVAFNVRGYWHSHVAAVLSAEHGIGVRHGCFCAHPLMLHLLDVHEEEASHVRDEIAHGRKGRVPGAVRASVGLGTTAADVDALASALEALVSDGPRWRYRQEPDSGEYLPDPETRVWPALPVSLSGQAVRQGESS